MSSALYSRLLEARRLIDQVACEARVLRRYVADTQNGMGMSDSDLRQIAALARDIATDADTMLADIEQRRIVAIELAASSSRLLAAE